MLVGNDRNGAGKARDASFTIIELLVVVVIIAIMAGMLLPVLSKSRDKSRETHCRNNFKQFGIAISMYSSEYDDNLPIHSDLNSGSNWRRAVFTCSEYYNDEFRVLQCPSDHDLIAPPEKKTDPFPFQANEYYWSYCYNTRNDPRYTGSGTIPEPVISHLPKFPMPAETIIFLEGNENDGGIEITAADAPYMNPDMEPYSRHNGAAMYLFDDSHVELRRPDSLSEAIFTPYKD